MPKNLKDVLCELIGEENLDDFAIWAFGTNHYELKEPMDFANSWNRLHQGIFRVHEEDAWVLDVIKMTKLWRQINE